MWQLSLFFYFTLGVAGYLLRRVLAQKFHHRNRLISGTFYLFFLWPAALVMSLTHPHNFHIGATNTIYLLVGSVIWPLYNLSAFRANKDVDVGVFSIINNLSPLVTLAIALPFLGEHLVTRQYAGIAVLIVSAMIAVMPELKKHHRAKLNGILWCLLTTVILGVAIAYERFMLNRIDFGTYVAIGWTSQVVWMTALTGRQWKHLPELIRTAGFKILFAYNFSGVLRSCAFILALLWSGSASVISGATDFMTVLIVVAAYFVLHERDHMFQKTSAALVGIVGLLMLTI
jgi:drug/metabolite transporter (DMT)-like permease